MDCLKDIKDVASFTVYDEVLKTRTEYHHIVPVLRLHCDIYFQNDLMIGLNL